MISIIGALTVMFHGPCAVVRFQAGNLQVQAGVILLTR